MSTRSFVAQEDMNSYPINLLAQISRSLTRWYLGVYYFFISLIHPICGLILRSSYHKIMVSSRYKKTLETLQKKNPGVSHVIICNHRSHLDSIMVKFYIESNPHLRIKNPYIVIARDLLKIPVLSQIIKWTCVIPLDRDNFQKDLFQNELDGILDRSDNLMFYPEGTRSRTDDVQEFKKGVFNCVYDYLQRHPEKKIIVVPFSVRYEDIAEHETFEKEKVIKKKIVDTGLLASVKWLLKILIWRKPYGSAYIVMGEPRLMQTTDNDYIIESLNEQIRAMYHSIPMYGVPSPKKGASVGSVVMAKDN